MSLPSYSLASRRPWGRGMLTPTAARLGWTPGGDVTADAAADPSTPRPRPSLQRAQLTSRCTGAAAHSGGQKWGGAPQLLISP